MDSLYTALFLLGFCSFVVSGCLLLLWLLTPKEEPITIRVNLRK